MQQSLLMAPRLGYQRRLKLLQENQRIVGEDQRSGGLVREVTPALEPHRYPQFQEPQQRQQVISRQHNGVDGAAPRAGALEAPLPQSSGVLGQQLHADAIVARTQARALTPPVVSIRPASEPGVAGVLRLPGVACVSGTPSQQVIDAMKHLERQSRQPGKAQAQQQQQRETHPGFPGAASQPPSIRRALSQAEIVHTLHGTQPASPEVSGVLAQQLVQPVPRPVQQVVQQSQSPRVQNEFKQQEHQNNLLQEQLRRQQQQLEEQHRKQLVQQQLQQQKQQLELKRKQQQQQRDLLEQQMELKRRQEKLNPRNPGSPSNPQLSHEDTTSRSQGTNPGSTVASPSPDHTQSPAHHQPQSTQSRPQVQQQVQYPIPSLTSTLPRDSSPPCEQSSSPSGSPTQDSRRESPTPLTQRGSPLPVSRPPAPSQQPQIAPGNAYLGPQRLQHSERAANCSASATAAFMGESAAATGRDGLPNAALPAAATEDVALRTRRFPGVESGKEDSLLPRSSQPGLELQGARVLQSFPRRTSAAETPACSASTAAAWQAPTTGVSLVGASVNDACEDERALSPSRKISPGSEPPGKGVSAAALGAAAAVVAAEVAAASVAPLPAKSETKAIRVASEALATSDRSRSSSPTPGHPFCGSSVPPQGSSVAQSIAAACAAGDTADEPSGPTPMEEDPAPSVSIPPPTNPIGLSSPAGVCAVSTVHVSTPCAVSMAMAVPSTSAVAPAADGRPVSGSWAATSSAPAPCPQFNTPAVQQCLRAISNGYVIAEAHSGHTQQPIGARVDPEMGSNGNVRVALKPGVGSLPGFSISMDEDHAGSQATITPEQEGSTNESIGAQIHAAMVIDATPAGNKPASPGTVMPMEVSSVRQHLVLQVICCLQ